MYLGKPPYTILRTNNMRFLIITIYFFCYLANAQENTSYELEHHTIYYNVFNSTMILPEIAQANQLVRAKNQVYLNIAVVNKKGGYGIPAAITASYRNLMQQEFTLNFIEIKEANAVYYLAPIRFNNEEVLHIDVQAGPADQSELASFRITKKLYKD